MKYALSTASSTKPSHRWSTMRSTIASDDPRRKISVKEAAKLNGISEDTFRRRYKHLIKQISPRRQAVTLGDVLAIGNAKK
jgi:transcription initiation factor TFIIIB Brf1 subunit/transcription initiation factor TFIIB